jgi:CDP-glucose 4,6-dehydratase
MAGEPILIRSPRSTRPWQHVLEPLGGYMLLAERLLSDPARFATAFNFGPNDDDAWPVEQIADRMVELWGGDARWVRDEADHVHEHRALRLDVSRAGAELGWRPRLRIERALEWSLDWYRAWQRGDGMQAFTLGQIAAYERLG